MRNQSPIYVQAVGCVCADVLCINQLRDALFQNQPSGIKPNARVLPDRLVHYGMVELANEDADLPRTLRLVRHALRQIGSQAGPLDRFEPHRIGVVLGSSTSGLKETEAAMQTRHLQGYMPDTFDIRTLNLHEPARFVAQELGVTGPVYTISNACASGAMAVISAVRLLQSGLVDAVITGGIDGASRFTTAGFDALSAMSHEPCLPFCAERAGINLGEGGALLLLTREPSDIRISGWAETSDAHHISAPHPEGKGAVACMREALRTAGLTPDQIDFVSAHGTGTHHNDAAESMAVHAVFGKKTPVASLKHLSGHTLAGAGALQGAIAYALLTDNDDGLLPANTTDGTLDPSLAPINLVREPVRLRRPLRHVLCNAFAFGGSNATLVFSRHS